jgi:hypothetical protein
MINWNVTKVDNELIALIAERAHGMAQHYGFDYSVADAGMDITAVHANGCPLDLIKLLESDNPNFGHDVFGIRRFIDRNTGKIDPALFDPRCSLSLKEAA